MKKIVVCTALVVALAGAAVQAQNANFVTSQANIIGPSGDAQFPLEVLGANGQTYFCSNTIEVRDGVNVRPSRLENPIVTNGLTATPLGTGGLLAGLAAAAVFIAVVGAGSSSDTSGTLGS
ncbi:MAG: hypothetical protein MK098_06300 [Marinovum sp.]|nr:hypothetical protein [Marinovum sp.]